MQIKCKKIAQIVLLILIISTVASIFIQSTKSQKESTEDSDKVGEIIEEIIPPETAVGGYVQDNIRKLAHFTEFFILGIEVSLYVALFLPSLKMMLLSYIFGILIASADETIQIFSGRGPAVKDVMIDFLGFVVSTVIIYTVSAVLRIIIQKSKQK